MYLKALEIQGFKSFPDKTVLNFGEDITAIVGPNGSGKSNVSDAIRWVMGEQSSKSLRGAKMEDVIFGGTQKRAAVGYAEATLVLDNQAGQLRIETPEVAITRRYYRSGESEYFINRQSARLRDINELLMDTGLGKEGYSNIGQGKVDEILALKSTDRREVFEEAAGISKYRHRKEETERRLANTEDNLLRIGDKISELELQVEPLREQAEKAKKARSGGSKKTAPVRHRGGSAKFASLKGKLTRPSTGRIVARYGAKRGAQAKWQGLLFRAPEGSDVRACAEGTVVFSDWLRGFGNLIIVDHGGTYMTVYANNESIFKNVGDRVKQGETIGSVGRSGGDQDAGLYFELRYKGKPVNPSAWLSSK